MNDVSILRPLLVVIAELSPLVAILTKLTLLLSLGWLGHALLLRANPRWRVLLWRGLAVGLVLIPLCHLMMPPIEYAGSRPVDTDLQRVTTADVARSGATATAVDSSGDLPPEAGMFHHAPHLAGEMSRGGTSWQAVLLAVWAGGFLFGVLRVVVGLLGIRSIIRRSTAASGRLTDEFVRVANACCATQAARVRVSAELSTPVLCGLVQQTLLLPCRMTEPSRADQLPGVFAHELSHLQARDLQWNLALHLSSSVLWFHPLAWFIRRAHAGACEAVSDAVAADYLGDVRAYCRTLAQVAVDAVTVPTWSLAMARTSDVHQRVRALEQGLSATNLSGVGSRIALGVLLAAAGAVGGVKLVRAASPPVLSKPQIQRQLVQDIQNSANGAAQQDLVSEETRTAINKGLAFLAGRQREDGSFGGEKVSHNDPAITALCGMAMLDAGSKPDAGTYGSHIQKAQDYLLDHVQSDGFIAVKENAGSMYVHAYALRFLCEAQLAQPSPRTKAAIGKAVDLIVKSQNAMDGWRYSPKSLDADSSVTSCQLISLQMARRAGVDVPDETIERAVKYLKRCQSPDGGYSYVLPAGNSALPRSAAVMAALSLSEVDQADLAEGLNYLNSNRLPPDGKAPYFFYSQFHLATALRSAGDPHFRRWYEPIRDRLVADQSDDGSWPGKLFAPDYPTAKAVVVLLSPGSS